MQLSGSAQYPLITKKEKKEKKKKKVTRKYMIEGVHIHPKDNHRKIEKIL